MPQNSHSTTTEASESYGGEVLTPEGQCPACGSVGTLAEKRKTVEGGHIVREHCSADECAHRGVIDATGSTESRDDVKGGLNGLRRRRENRKRFDGQLVADGGWTEDSDEPERPRKNPGPHHVFEHGDFNRSLPASFHESEGVCGFEPAADPAPIGATDPGGDHGEGEDVTESYGRVPPELRKAVARGLKPWAEIVRLEPFTDPDAEAWAVEIRGGRLSMVKVDGFRVSGVGARGDGRAVLYLRREERPI